MAVFGSGSLLVKKLKGCVNLVRVIVIRGRNIGKALVRGEQDI
jgi:hypothetical protein